MERKQIKLEFIPIYAIRILGKLDKGLLRHYLSDPIGEYTYIEFNGVDEALNQYNAIIRIRLPIWDKIELIKVVGMDRYDVIAQWHG